MWPGERVTRPCLPKACCRLPPSLLLRCRAWTLDAFIPRSPAAHTTPSCVCVALSSYHALKEGGGGSRGALFFRATAFFSFFFFWFAVVPDVSSPLVLFKAVCTIPVRLWVSNTHKHRDTSLASPLFLFLISVFRSCEASWEALISLLAKTWAASPESALTGTSVYPCSLFRWASQSCGDISCRDVGLLSDINEVDGTQLVLLKAAKKYMWKTTKTFFPEISFYRTTSANYVERRMHPLP